MANRSKKYKLAQNKNYTQKQKGNILADTFPNNSIYNYREINRSIYGYKSRNYLYNTLKEELINYWSSFFIFSDKNLNKRKRLIIQVMWESGCFGVTKIDNDYVIYNVATFEQNLFSDITKGTGIVSYAYKTDTLLITHMKNGILQKSTKYFKPMGNGIKAYIDNWIDSYETLSINRDNSTRTKFVKVSNLNAKSIDEVKEIHKPNQRIVVLTGGEEVIDNNFKNETDLSWADIHQAFADLSMHTGIRTNLIGKESGAKLEEVSNGDFYFLAQEGQWIEIMKEFIDNLNTLYSTNITFKTLVEEQKENKQIKQEMNQYDDM